MINPWLGIAGVLAVLLGVMAGLRAWGSAQPVHAELSRKLMHISLGLLTASFPWLFDDVWPVLVLCSIIVLWLLGLRYLPALGSRLGGVIHAVERRSLGELYFPISAAVLFVVAQGDRLLYCVPILILTLADTAAALIGKQYGHWKYTTPEGTRKSAEGSVAFFMVAFFSVHVPLLLLTAVPRAETLLIGLILGLLVTLFEAIAWGGLDNVFIPLGSYFLLKQLLGLSITDLTVQLSVIAAVAAIATLRRNQTTFDDSALLGAVLAAYFIWVLGGWQWMVIPLLLFVLGRPLRSASATDPSGTHFHHLEALVSVACPGLAWLGLANVLHRPDLFYPFMLTFAVHLALFEVGKLGPAADEQSPALLGTLCGTKSWLLLTVPFVLIEGVNPDTLTRAALALPVVIAATTGFVLTQPRRKGLPVDASRWLRQAGWSSLGSAVGLVPLLLR